MLVDHIAYACLTIHCQAGHGDDIAVQWIDKSLSATPYSFAHFEVQSNKIANAMRQHSIRPGDVVSIFLPKIPEVISSFFGVLKCQAYACILFSTLGDDALLDRLRISGTKIIITTRSLLRKILSINDQLPALTVIFVLDKDEDLSDNIMSLNRILAGIDTVFDFPHQVDAETPAFLQYTSGSTGKPKAALHVHGALEDLKKSFDEILQVQQEDVYWCTADPAWITGLVYGIIAPFNARTQLIQYGGGYQAANWMKILADQSVRIWYTAPTALRMMMQEHDVRFEDYDHSALKRIYSVGEPLNPEIMVWCKKTFNQDIFDTWFQSETGCIMIANRPGFTVKAGSFGLPREGIHVEILDDRMVPVPDGVQGNLCIQSGWGSMFRTYFNNDTAYREKFSDHFYITGDLAKKDQDGYLWYISRADDVINIGGHLVGPFEIESALLEMDEIGDVAVVGASDPILYQKIVAFIVLREGFEWTRQLELKCRIHISNKVSTVAIPSEFCRTDQIPKNQSGKILRRVLKALYEGNDPGDLSTMESI